jgi:hypothetical protein
LPAPVNGFLHPLPYRIRGDPQRLQYLDREALAYADQSQQEMLGTNVVMVQPPSLLLGLDHNEPRPFGKSLEHLALPPFAFIPRCTDAEDGPR